MAKYKCPFFGSSFRALQTRAHARSPRFVEARQAKDKCGWHGMVWYGVRARYHMIG